MPAKGGGGVGRLLRQMKTGDWFSRRIDQHFETKGRKESWGKPSPAIHPSGAGSQCEREIELGMLGHRTVIPGGSRRRMDNGNSMHDRWGEYFKDMKILVASEVPVHLTDPVVSGRLDIIVQNPENGQTLMVELKSVNERGFKLLPRSSSDRVANMRAMYAWNHPWGRGYALQQTWYAEYGRHNGKKFDEVAFLFEDKNTQEYRVIYVEVVPDLLKEARFRPTLAQVAYGAGKLLGRPYQSTHPICKKCERSDLCDALEDVDGAAWQILIAQFLKGGIRVERLTGAEDK